MDGTDPDKRATSLLVECDSHEPVMYHGTWYLTASDSLHQVKVFHPMIQDEEEPPKFSIKNVRPNGIDISFHCESKDLFPRAVEKIRMGWPIRQWHRTGVVIMEIRAVAAERCDNTLMAVWNKCDFEVFSRATWFWSCFCEGLWSSSVHSSYRQCRTSVTVHRKIQFFHGLKISQKIFSSVWTIKGLSGEYIRSGCMQIYPLGVLWRRLAVIFYYLFLSSWVANKKLVALFLLNWLLF